MIRWVGEQLFGAVIPLLVILGAGWLLRRRLGPPPDS